MSGSPEGTGRSRADKRRDTITQATEDGMVVQYGAADVLQLDIDSPADLERAKSLLTRMKKIIGWTNVRQTRSRSGNWHLYVHLGNPIPMRERMLLQGVLGSDPVRSILDWDTAHDQEECFLFELPGAAARVVKLIAPERPDEDRAYEG